MSKYVKELEVKTLRKKLDGVEDLLVVNMVGVPSGETMEIRTDLAKKGIHLHVVKNNLAKIVLTEHGMTSVGGMLLGPSAVAWGGKGISDLAKELLEWAKKHKKLEIKGACVNGQAVDASGVEALSKLPTREEMIGQVVARIQSPGARLASLILAAGSNLAGQIKTLSEEKKDGAAG